MQELRLRAQLGARQVGNDLALAPQRAAIGRSRFAYRRARSL
jgi:hypothetical protein